MSSYNHSSRSSSFASLWRSFGQQEDFDFANLLCKASIERACSEEGVDFASRPDDIWKPAITIWAFLWQCLSGAESCVAAVARVVALRVALSLPACSANSGAYCKARAKLPVSLLVRLTRQAGEQLEEKAPEDWRWLGRHPVKLVDGFQATLADTEEIRKEYPQTDGQPEGVSYPMIQVVVLLSLATGAVLDAAEGPCRGKETGETALLREMFDRLHKGDVLVGDRLYGSYWLLAWLLQRGAHGVFRLHGSRRFDKRDMYRLGKGDYWVRWYKPTRWPWLDKDSYDEMAESLMLRMVRVLVQRPGYRTRQLRVVTTFLDHRVYRREDIAQLYEWRWQAELDIRSIKRSMKLEPLRCQTPDMVRKELWGHWLAYNLIRQLMAESGHRHGLRPRQLSFCGAMQTLAAFRGSLLTCTDESLRDLCQCLWKAIATHRVGHRKGRVEPRRVKKTKRRYPRLDKSRQQAREELLNGKKEPKK